MTYHTLALGTLVYEKNHTINTYPKIQESYETTYTYLTLKIQNLCNTNTSMFYIPRNLQHGCTLQHTRATLVSSQEKVAMILVSFTYFFIPLDT